MKILAFLLVFAPLFTFGQTSFKSKVDSLKYVSDMPYICHEPYISDATTGKSPGCGDRLFWEVVKFKENAIQLLIDKLDDNTPTEIPSLFGFNHTVADIAYTALEEIIQDIPTFELLGVEFDQNGCGYCAYWQHLNAKKSNRKKFKQAVQAWYIANKDKLVWVNKGTFSSCDCGFPHPNGGHYELRKN